MNLEKNIFLKITKSQAFYVILFSRWFYERTLRVNPNTAFYLTRTIYFFVSTVSAIKLSSCQPQLLFQNFHQQGILGWVSNFCDFRKASKTTSHFDQSLYSPKDGTTTEIDLIYLSIQGIFVIESKNYSGWIFGNEKQKYWTQTFENKQKFRFFNPIWQNAAHISALKEVLPEELSQHLHSLIVFSNQAVLKKVTVTSENILVIKREQLKGTLHQMNKTISDSLSPTQLAEISRLLSAFTHPDEQIKQQHIATIQAKQK